MAGFAPLRATKRWNVQRSILYIYLYTIHMCTTYVPQYTFYFHLLHITFRGTSSTYPPTLTTRLHSSSTSPKNIPPPLATCLSTCYPLTCYTCLLIVSYCDRYYFIIPDLKLCRLLLCCTWLSHCDIYYIIYYSILYSDLAVPFVGMHPFLAYVCIELRGWRRSETASRVAGNFPPSFSSTNFPVSFVLLFFSSTLLLSLLSVSFTFSLYVSLCTVSVSLCCFCLSVSSCPGNEYYGEKRSRTRGKIVLPVSPLRNVTSTW